MPAMRMNRVMRIKLNETVVVNGDIYFSSMSWDARELPRFTYLKFHARFYDESSTK